MHILINRLDIFNETILRWALVGFLTFIIDYISFLVFYINLNNVLFSNFSAAIISITFNYLSHFFWTFKSQTSHYYSSYRYFLNLLLFWILSTILLSLLISVGVDAMVAKFIPIIVIAPISFLSLKFIVFRRKT